MPFIAPSNCLTLSGDVPIVYNIEMKRSMAYKCCISHNLSTTVTSHATVVYKDWSLNYQLRATTILLSDNFELVLGFYVGCHGGKGWQISLSCRPTVQDECASYL